jgi:MFS superfamily sulfate permease-like transporter
LFPIATALRRSFTERYDSTRLRADALSGLVVGVVAVPLSMALAIAVGAPPQAGLYTAAIAGAVAALAGGSKFQVTGPTAAFIVVLAPIGALDAISASTRVIVMHLGQVGVIDATGFVALESSLEALHKKGKFVILAGPLPKPEEIFRRASLESHMPNLIITDSLPQALQVATDLSHLNPDWKLPPPSSLPRSGVSRPSSP